ncbi:alpha-ketoglutarate-dependent dioxygenase AlkB family protein [Flavobacterium psychrotolerans]|uniref:Alpha-ketoglutarate-dependent dioxygenase AlkB n=1 Tax=Flavobacterium psychrotolerans TaxID=2169410 RepID=A0A2U1JFK6_9FLAO|nr:alpha-ketoglutarate-dependent dioxygenase AlkB [Flavobacterium psychrotolerans]PWA03881.1 alpha-ketoglutarate-dependent dioxygenase AlkB [Flavobacterium psychrotolerans]
MKSLFQLESIPLDLPDAEIIYFPAFIDKTKADEIYAELLEKTPWQQDEITVYGKKHAQPRLTALYGNQDKPYSYSNIKMQPHHWTVLLLDIKSHVENLSNSNFTTVLLNQYRNGNDGNGWHADNEKELGANPVIASVSFGAERPFQLKHNTDKNLKKNIILEHGSLLIMKGTTQHFWKHQIPKITKPIGQRINLTFRTIL